MGKHLYEKFNEDDASDERVLGQVVGGAFGVLVGYLLVCLFMCCFGGHP